jgi:hypothetical protein
VEERRFSAAFERDTDGGFSPGRVLRPDQEATTSPKGRFLGDFNAALKGRSSTVVLVKERRFSAASAPRGGQECPPHTSFVSLAAAAGAAAAHAAVATAVAGHDAAAEAAAGGVS